MKSNTETSISPSNALISAEHFLTEESLKIEFRQGKKSL
ncbi:hypothetical protein OKW21_002040 [Catalinimonas alkaloidigena]|nr:hypothetical protein [Catalinimonas alkaloidigena]